jgi:RNA polymerase sigma-70 factor (ECF subfamily)
VSGDGLSRAFVESLRVDLRERAAAIPNLEPRLRELCEASARRWPSLDLSSAAFVADLAETLAREEDLEQALSRVNAPELYLTCACARGDNRAVKLFRENYFGEIRAAVASLRAAPSVAEEVEQNVGQKLFAAAEGAVPRIRDYAGRGSLKTWFRVVATRAAVSVLRKGAKEAPTPDDALLQVRAEDDDPELATLKHRYRDDFKSAFEAAVGALEVRQRNLLRHQLVDELGVDEIAAIYRVHRVTASRWLAQARRDVWRGTRDRLSAKLGASSRELESLLRVIRTDLDLSLTRLLASRKAEPAQSP